MRNVLTKKIRGIQLIDLSECGFSQMPCKRLHVWSIGYDQYDKSADVFALLPYAEEGRYYMEGSEPKVQGFMVCFSYAENYLCLEMGQVFEIQQSLNHTNQ